MPTKMKSIQLAGDATDASFAEAVEQLTCLVEAREHGRAAQFIDANPQHADKLRRLLPAIEALASLDNRTSPLPATGEGAGATAGPRSGSAVADSPSSVDGHGQLAGVLGDFRIQREIGRGGMGVVYEATQISLNRRVALKVLPLAAMLDARRLERFRHEAQAAAMLRHPHIVTVYSVGCERGVHYYAMDFIDGPSLAQVVDQLSARGEPHPASSSRDASHPAPSRRRGGLGRGDGPVSPAANTPPHQREGHIPTDADTQPVAALSTLRTTQPAEFFRAIARLGIQATEALDYAHQMGVVHRDVKPSNLLIDAQGHLWITDFGLAMTQNDAGLTMTGDLLGTLRYMSPEQAAGKRLPLDHRTDVYSLGITLYELLAGRPAFDTTGRGELLRSIAEIDPPPLRKLVPTIPADLETICICRQI